MGIELPFLLTWPVDAPEGADDDEDDLMIRISFKDEYLDQPVEGEFQISENLLKGIATNRDEDLKSFVNAFSPTIRRGYMQAVLRHELHVFESERFDDQRLIDKWEAYNVFQSFGTMPWTVSDAMVQAMGPDLFRVEIVFQNEKSGGLVGGQAKVAETHDYDILILPTSLTWDEFASATETAENLTDMLKRIHRDFVVRKDDLAGRYSDEVKQEIEYLDALAEGDEDLLAEDPFMTSELTLDSDGRVHFSKDLEQ